MCVCSTLSLLYRLLFCNDLKKPKKKVFFLFFFSSHSVCVCVRVFGALDFFFFFFSFLFCLPEIKNFVFVVLDLTAQPSFLFFLDSHTRKQNFVVSRCVLFFLFLLLSFRKKTIHLKCFLFFRQH